MLRHGLAVAVVVLTGGLGKAQGDLAGDVKAALELARPALMAHLDRPSLHGGVLGLLCLAALHDGVKADDPILQKALQRLSKAELSQTYDISLRLMVAESCPQLPDRDKLAKSDCRELLSHRRGGGFGYRRGDREWDLSNSQYAALGLRAAVSIGVDVPHKVWTRLADTVIDAQRRYGGFGYRENGKDVSASMTAAGIAVLAICRQQLQRPGREIPKLDKQIQRGWGWFAKNPGAIGARDPNWSYYFHYGLERAAILCDVEEVAGVDWYETGARMLIRDQQGGGGWQTKHGMMYPGANNRGSTVDTAFAVLFLRRGFQKVAGPVTGPRTVSLAAITVDSSGASVHECARQLTARGKPALKEILIALRSDIAPRRRAAWLALQTIAGQAFGFDPEASPRTEANSVALRAAELWYLENR